MLNGARLYCDIVEPNAPPPYLFGAASAALGRLVGLAPEPAFLLTFTLIIPFVIYRTDRILSRLFSDQPYVAPFLTLMVTYCLFPHVKDMFGEREHILTWVTIYLPNHNLLHPTLNGRAENVLGERLGAGTLAGARLAVQAEVRLC